jgi:acyl-CoA thioester hydrolase
MPELHLTYRGTVYPWQCDHMGHMNVMWYVGKFDEATWQFFTTIGLTPSFLRQNGRAMAAVDQRISYKRELYAGDVVTIRSEALEVKDRSIRFVHEMRHDETDEVVATTILVAVHLDAVARKACPLPAEIKHRAQSRLTADATRWT